MSQIARAQNTFEPIHGVTGYDYHIKGELELRFSHQVDFKDGRKLEATYRIKSPVVLAFNLNDLKYFKARPGEFAGYVENPDGLSGGLVDIPQGGLRDQENWMEVDEHLKSWENGELSEIKAKGEIYPLLTAFFSIPGFSDQLKSNLNQLQFRVTISGISNEFHPQRNVVVEYNNQEQKLKEAGNGFLDEESLKQLEAADPTMAAEIREGDRLMRESARSASSPLSVAVSCGVFFGFDLTDALIKNNLVEDNSPKKKAFENRFRETYFKDLPHFGALPLINFLINPAGNYQIPINGSFASDSEYGAENATYTGTLKLFGDAIQKSEL